ncbi:enoyl-CoA hydratase/isomerase family protein [bacterium]|nr:enoyl-CoA hydratase/isomerase family protein [bacterium]
MEKLRYEIGGDGVAQIIMDDGKANAMNDIFFKELMILLDRVQKDQAKVVVFTGNNGIFSGGLDLGYLISLSKDGLVAFIEQFAKAMIRVYTLPIPTIAACNGHTIAGGLMLALACDVRFIADGNYKIQMNETINGIPIPKWMLLIANLTVAPQWRPEMLLHAHLYSPREAIEKGFFNGMISENPDILKDLKSRIEDLKKVNPVAYAKTKQRMSCEQDILDSIKLLKEEFGD